MNSPETIQMLLKTVFEIRDTVGALNERSKNYFASKHSLEESQKQHTDKIEKLEIDVSNLKRDRWWMGTISSAIGGFIVFLLGKLL